MLRLIALCSIFIFFGCSPKSLDDFREEGQREILALLTDLNGIMNREQLLKACPSLKQHFDNLAAIMIAARQFQQKKGMNTIAKSSPQEEDLSEELRIELNRIYGIEGGQKMIEKCQEEALNKLDAYEKQRIKKRDASIKKIF